MREIKAVIQPFMLESVLHALAAIDDLPGVTVSQVIGWGRTRSNDSGHVVQEAGHAFTRKTKLELVVPASIAPRIIQAIVAAARTGSPGDGKIFVSEVASAVRIRTGEEDEAAI